jgi:di/tripeptidase
VSRVLDTFLELVRIDSPSGRERACGEYVAQALRSATSDAAELLG